MRLDLNPDQEFFRSTTRRFLDEFTDTAALREMSKRDTGFDRSWWEKGAELGWTSLLVSEENGGGSISGQPVADLAIIAEEHGKSAAPGPLGTSNVVVDTLARGERHADLVQEIISGRAVASWTCYEPGQGWAPHSPRLVATAYEDSYVLNGVKDRVEEADQADLFLVGANVEGRLTQFLVPADAAGVRVEKMWGLDFTRQYATVTFDDVVVPQSCVVGSPGDAAAAIERQSRLAFVLQAVETAGVADRVFELTLQWAFNRYSFGRPLASYQAIKHRFATMKMWVEAMHATTSAAVRALDEGSDSAAVLSRVAKVYVAEHALDLLQDCVQIHGGIGVTWEHDLHIFLRRATVNRALYGTPEELRTELADLIGSGKAMV